MSDADVELGPVDYVVVAFPAGQAHFSGEMGSTGATTAATGVVVGLDCSGNRELIMTLPVWTCRIGRGRAECPALEGLAAPEGSGR